MATQTLSADTVHLRDGSEISGTIIGHSRSSLKIKTQKGVQTIPKSEVKRVQYDNADARQKEQRERALKRKRLSEEARRKIETEARKAAELKEKERLKSEAEARKKSESEARARSEADEPSARNFVLRSAVLPGWGQLSAGQKWKGYGLIAASVLTATYTLYNYNKSLGLRSQYNASQSLWNGFLLSNQSPQAIALRYFLPQPDQSSLNAVEKNVRNFGLLTALLYSYSLVDAFFLTGNQRDVQGQRPVSNRIDIKLSAGGNSFQASFIYKF